MFRFMKILLKTDPSNKVVKRALANVYLGKKVLGPGLKLSDELLKSGSKRYAGSDFARPGLAGARQEW